jgi:universal stress protein A
MSHLPGVLCPVDFSDSSRAALCYAAAIADHFGARLTVMTVDDPLLSEAAASAGLRRSLGAETERELRHFSAEALGHSAAGAKTVEFRVAVGKPASEIIREARAISADLIVISSRGRSGLRKMFFGSTTERVLRETTVPVLITPDERPRATSLSEIARHINRVIAPVDLTSASPHQVTIASAIAEALAVPLIIPHVLEPIFIPLSVRLALPGADNTRRAQVDERLSEIKASISRRVGTEVLVSTGEPSEEIVHLAETRGANLIVMGLHSGGPLGARMGAVTYRVLCQTRALVLALPPQTVTSDAATSMAAPVVVESSR